MLKFETNARFPTGEVKQIPRYEEVKGRVQLQIQTSTKLIPIIQGFLIGKFTYSLKLISNPKINFASLITHGCCTELGKKSQLPYSYIPRQCSVVFRYHNKIQNRYIKKRLTLPGELEKAL